jgi:1-acyl-sn-glycerol-3-phosphate acyltransferase
MKHLLATTRALLLCALTAALYMLWIAAVALTRSASARRKWRYAVFRAWARGVAGIAQMTIAVRGTAPRPPFLLVSNHLSYIDVIALSSLVDCTYVARGDVADWPVIGRLCQGMEILFVDRTRRRDVRRVGACIDRALADGEGVVLFPEGTSTPGAAVGSFKPSLLEPAAKRRIPVHYASVSYRTPPGAAPAHLAVCWWGDMTFLKHLFELLQLPAFEAAVTFGNEPIEGDDRKTLAASLRRAVSEQFVPVTFLEEACTAKIL